MKEGQTPGPRVRVVWVTGWGPAALHSAVTQPEVSGPGEAAERGRLEGGEGSKDNSRRTSSVQYGRLSHYYYNIL